MNGGPIYMPRIPRINFRRTFQLLLWTGTNKYNDFAVGTKLDRLN